jgi:hypothetical protein
VPLSVTVTAVLSSGVAITDTGASPPYVWQIADLAPGVGGIITLTGELSPTLSDGTLVNVAEIVAENAPRELGGLPGERASAGTVAAATLTVDGETTALRGAWLDGRTGLARGGAMAALLTLFLTYAVHRSRARRRPL